MPELPEVEVVRRCLEPVVAGRVLSEVQVRHPRTARRNRSPADVVDRLEGRRVVEVARTGKFLRLPLEGDLLMVLHLGMSGRVELARPGDPEQPHTHFVAQAGADHEVRLIDPRTFGFVAVLTPEEVATSSLAGLGPDAFDRLPSTRALAGLLAGRTAPIKALLLDQRMVSGLGNIYADEVLHRARIDPLRPAGSLDGGEVGRLRASIRPVLTAGIEHGGTSLDDLAYLLPDGRAGEYLHRLRAYGREGLPCRRCGAVIVRRVVAQRSTYSCPGCQT